LPSFFADAFDDVRILVKYCWTADVVREIEEDWRTSGRGGGEEEEEEEEEEAAEEEGDNIFLPKNKQENPNETWSKITNEQLY